ncbi:MAG: hypothetical protein J5654_03275 [Victivallales bacterium]|nr:hypothetical protein [Victivallales bacterium]
MQPTVPSGETIRSSNNHNVAPFSHFSISNEKIAMPFHNLYHNCPVKQQSQAKNHRKTKIPFPFPPLDLQLAEIALHYFQRGWGHTSLIGTRMRIPAKTQPMTGWLKSLSWQPCLASVARRTKHSFFTGQQ